MSPAGQSLERWGRGQARVEGAASPTRRADLAPWAHGARAALSEALSSGLGRPPPGPAGLPLHQTL